MKTKTRSLFQAAFDLFMSQDFYSACDDATKVNRLDLYSHGYAVELFDDATYRVLRRNDIGNLYDSPGIILGIEPMTDEEIDEDDPDNNYYDRAIDAMRDKFEEVIEQMD